MTRLASSVRLRLLAAIALGALLLAGCIPDSGGDGGGSAAGGDGGDADTLVVGTTADVEKFNPLDTTSRTDIWVLNLMYPTLMEIDAEGRKTPYLATEWRYEDGGRTAVVRIRDDFTWSDGRPLTAKDVAFTANAAKKEQIGLVGGMVGDMREAVAQDDTTVVFHLDQPYVGFLTDIGFWMHVVPEHVFGKQPSVAKFANDSGWVGAGPYTLTRFERGQRYLLEASDSYPFAPDGKVPVENLEFRVFPDVNTLLLALRNGDVDISAEPIPVASVKQVQATDGLELVEQPALGWGHFTPNTKRPPLDRLEVRQALAMVADRQAVIDVVFQGAARPAEGVVSPVLTQWDNPDLKVRPFDPEGARRLLTQAGFKADGSGRFPELTFDIIYDQGDPDVSRWVQMLRDDAATAGITIKLSGSERNTYIQRSLDGDFDLYAGAWAIMDEPVNYLQLAFHSAGKTINYGHVADPELDDLINRARRAPSAQAAAPLVNQAEQLIEDRAYDVPLYAETFQFAYNADRVQGVVPQPSDLLGIINPRSLGNVRPAADS